MDEIVPSSANDNSWFTSLTVKNSSDEYKIVSGFTPKKLGENPRRIIKVDDTQLGKQAEIVDYMKVIWLTPQMDGLFSSSPSVRRKVVDRLTYNIYPSHAEVLSKYEFATRSRLKLLAEGSYNSAWMKSIEMSIVENGLHIYENRKSALMQIEESLSQLETEFLKPGLKLQGEFEDFIENKEIKKENLKEELLKKYQIMRKVDTKAKKTIFGPNRADLIAINTAKSIKANLCSTGEQKSMVVALTLGQVKNLNDKYNIKPVVLLDEIFSHFDNERIKLLIDEIKNLDAQFWITTTDTDLSKQIYEDCISINV